MPRLIPRLLRSLAHVRSRSPRASRTGNLALPLSRSKTRVYTRPEEVNISPDGRTQSILLDKKALRLIYRHARYQRSKGPAPHIHVSESRRKARRQAARGDIPREMTDEERIFYANPYLRMLGSPLRQCLHTNWLLPRDLLIRMTPMLLPGPPSERPKCAFLPDGIEHPSFSRSVGGHSSYILCLKGVVRSAREKGTYKRFMPDGVLPMNMHPHVLQQIGHTLRVRVLQELQLLARSLLRRRRSARPDEPPLLRRLTRAEWKEIQATGVVPFKNAVAVLVVPPPNKDPETKTRPVPETSALPTTENLAPGAPPKALPLSVMHSTETDETPRHNGGLPDTVSTSRVPLYNGVSLFPSRAQRAALYAALGEVLRAERTTRFAAATSKSAPGYEHPSGSVAQRPKGDQKASHAILVCSDEQTLLKADTVPLAIALWRIRMWEGDMDQDSFVDWIKEPSRTP
ncbi:hypothetical protein C8Q78DRAFT_1002640 [Trametes maxima]|nr:hypothetical protein C8Q78DRAFT_1002640 [Trametes maxima]